MDRQLFESLPIEKQVEFMNERPKKKLKEIAEEIGMPASSLGSIFNKAGYVRRQGLYVLDEAKAETPQAESTESAPIPQNEELQELLQYKDQLIALVTEKEKQEAPLDFSTLSQYKDEDGKINWSTLTFQIPTELHEQLDEYLEKRGYKKQFLLSLIVQQFLNSK